MSQTTLPDALRPLYESARQAMAVLDEIALDETQAGGEAVPGEFARYIQGLEQLSGLADRSQFAGLQDVCHWLCEEAQHHSVAGQLNWQTIALHYHALTLLTDYMATACDTVRAETLLNHFKLPQWHTPLEEDDVQILSEMLAVADMGETIGVADRAPAAGDNANDLTGGADVSEDVLRVLSEEAGRIAQRLPRHAPSSGDGLWRSALDAFSGEVDQFSHAVAAAGLVGLSEVLFYLTDNVRHLADGEHGLSEPAWALVGAWPPTVHSYLRNIEDAGTWQAMVDYLSDNRWPAPLPDSDVAGLLELLALPRCVRSAQPVSARPSRVSEHHVSLALPDDASADVLDALLEELPLQSAQFGAAVRKLINGTGQLDDVKTAMRIAHALKGAANTVGVAGVANLTHYLEDILEALFEHRCLPANAVAMTLAQAADCLEAMTEALMGMGEVPDDAVETLQCVLDWANRIEVEGLEGIGERLDDASPSVPSSVEDAARGDAAPGAGLRLAPELMDSLLRLLGESAIVNSQVQSRVHHLGEQSKAVRKQHERVQVLLNQLDQLINVKGRQVEVAGNGGEAFDVLELEHSGEVHACISRLEEAVVDAREISDALMQQVYGLSELVVEQERLHKEKQSAIYRSRMVAARSIVPRLERAVRQACRLTGKAVALRVDGGETLIDNRALADLIEPLMHLLRNAVDHGIEPSPQRRDAGKDEQGAIRIQFARRGDLIEVACEDDGAGFDTDRIHDIAQAQGLIPSNEALSDDDVNRFVLAPRFTTKETVTQLSGRGIGMDAVYARVREMKGALSLHSRPGEGLKVVIQIPVSMLSVPAVLVRCANQCFAISNYGVEQILHGRAGEYAYGDDGAELIYQDQRVTMVHLTALLGIKSRQQLPRPIILVGQDEGPKKAVLVDEVIYSREMIVKSLGPFVPQLRGIVGVTILGDGEVAPVLDLPELLSADVYRQECASDADAMLEDVLPRALVVDDSLSARRALAEFVEDCGYDVQTAIDGMDALVMLHKHAPDILFVDLEMPRMNGMELARYVRVNSELAAIPIVMVTSRAGDKHRRQASAAGVDALISKPFNEDELYRCMETLRPSDVAQA